MISAGLTARDYGDYQLVSLQGELDVIDAAVVGAALAAAVAANPRLVIDLTGLRFIDCCALSVLFQARSQARRAGGDLLLAAPGVIVRRVIALAATPADLTVHPSAGEAALAAGWAGAPAALGVPSVGP